ncbi:hypothetical protein Q4503_17840 [Colwellia sp. 6_MG-2023]|uniref:hypothetical protein n=1 Tax=Colwellia sp. 6_MG-2023 TaxID=3062676 RepID=UPI0026E2AD59|nr:hypothetical protein [Colwellia sp. 6_MG-2023]MDO6489561.1 hypothetical protein [Colwellia sp. 6_MG-2023]
MPQEQLHFNSIGYNSNKKRKSSTVKKPDITGPTSKLSIEMLESRKGNINGISSSII